MSTPLSRSETGVVNGVDGERSPRQTSSGMEFMNASMSIVGTVGATLVLLFITAAFAAVGCVLAGLNLFANFDRPIVRTRARGDRRPAR
jgi:hypothetical protein